MKEAIPVKLKAHYNGHHKGVEPQWLKYDEIPVRCVYSNFENFVRRTTRPEEWEEP